MKNRRFFLPAAFRIDSLTCQIQTRQTPYLAVPQQRSVLILLHGKTVLAQLLWKILLIHLPDTSKAAKITAKKTGIPHIADGTTREFKQILYNTVAMTVFGAKEKTLQLQDHQSKTGETAARICHKHLPPITLRHASNVTGCFRAT